MKHLKKETNVVLNESVLGVLKSLQHLQVGPTEMYIKILQRIYNAFLHNSDQLGLTEKESIYVLQVLDLLLRDIKILANISTKAYAFGTDKDSMEIEAANFSEKYDQK